MRRRELIALGCSTPLFLLGVASSYAQTRSIKIGILSGTSASGYRQDVKYIESGLAERGFVVGSNLEILEFWADGDYSRLPSLASQLLARDVSAVIAFGTSLSAQALQALTRVTPIIFVIGADPVSTNLVTNMSRPEANLTGLTIFSASLLGKRINLFKDIVPGLSSLAFLRNPNNPIALRAEQNIEDLAKRSGVDIKTYDAPKGSNWDDIFRRIKMDGCEGCILSSDATFSNESSVLAAISLSSGVPILHNNRIGPESGGLMSYAADHKEVYHQAGVYTARILKGELPSALPVLQPTKFELVINMKAAGRFGMSIPLILQVSAEMID